MIMFIKEPLLNPTGFYTVIVSSMKVVDNIVTFEKPTKIFFEKSVAVLFINWQSSMRRL